MSDRSKKIAESVIARIYARLEEEQIDELSKKTLGSYVKKASHQAFSSGVAGGAGIGRKGYEDQKSGEKNIQKGAKRLSGINVAASKLSGHGYTKVQTSEEADVLDTSLSCVEPSKTGEVYKKESEKSTAATTPTGTKTGVTAGKTGEAYSSTGITQRNTAVESAVMDVMTKTFEKRRIYQESSQFAIVSPEQRNDWLNVEQGRMDVVDYFNKYRVTGEE